MGRDVAVLLPELIENLVKKFPWPKRMRWGDGKQSWIRPLNQGLCLFDGRAIEFSLSFGGSVTIKFGKTTQGHRFLAPDFFMPRNFEDYEAGLRKAYVILCRTDRQKRIEEQAIKLAAAQGLQVRRDPGLIAELAGLVEWPYPLMGRIDAPFMDLPQEVLISSMRTHQKYMALLTEEGALAPFFILVADRDPDDGGTEIIAGNERVLRSRLSDARFFWEQDQKILLPDRLPALANILFHAKLGSMADRSERISKLAYELAAFIPNCDAKRAGEAALLAKTDLTTGMVGEFPELQGVMGFYYIGNDYDREIAQAIADHYAPQGPRDRCPVAPISVATALADKLDLLAGFWLIDEKPTGSKDPYALRRAALGVIRLIVENGLRLSLGQLIRFSVNIYVRKADTESVTRDLLDFFFERLKVDLRDQGLRHDLIAAALAVASGEKPWDDDLVRIVLRGKALQHFLDRKAGADLLHAYRRAINILRIEEKKHNQFYRGSEINKAILQEKQEIFLYNSLNKITKEQKNSAYGDNFIESMEIIAKLKDPIDDFFETVTVNIEKADLRENRLNLLARFRNILNSVADFAQIEG